MIMKKFQGMSNIDSYINKVKLVEHFNNWIKKQYYKNLFNKDNNFDFLYRNLEMNNMNFDIYTFFIKLILI